MADEKKNGRVSVRDVIAGVAVVAALGGSWWTFGKDTGRLDQRVTTIERQREEDRRDIRDRLKNIEDKAERTDKNVQEIRLMLEGMKREGGRR